VEVHVFMWQHLVQIFFDFSTVSTAVVVKLGLTGRRPSFDWLMALDPGNFLSATDLKSPAPALVLARPIKAGVV